MNPNNIFALSLLQRDISLAAQGDILAAVRAGYRHYSGLAGKRDLNLARHYFVLGARGVADNSPWIHFMNIQVAAFNEAPLPEGSFEKLSSLANNGDVIAMTLLGRVKERGYDRAGRNIAAAKAAYLAVGSQFVLAETFLGGIYVRRNHLKIAKQHFLHAWKCNETKATVGLALIYVHEHRPVEAKKLLIEAVFQNNCQAMYRLAQLYQRGIGKADPQPTLATRLLKHSASMGYPPAIALLQKESALADGRRSSKYFDQPFNWMLTYTSEQRNG